MKLIIKKIFALITFVFVLNMLFLPNVKAANASVSITSSASQLVVGNNVTFTVRVQTDIPIGAWDYATSVSNNLTYVSGSAVSKSANLPSNGSTKVITYTFTYRAKSSGTATFNFKMANVLDYANVSPMSFPSNTAKSINIITQAQLEASYSKNNNLSSLSIDGYTLSPSFNKNTLEYNVELPNGVTKIKVNASKEDNTASIQGTGEKTVSEGKNKIEIKVTAQNGSVKTYVINATVKELDPILVTVNNHEYNVVRKKSQITPPNSTFTETIIKINDLEVPAFENKKINYTLVGLKDNDGKIDLYIYNNVKNSYTKYYEYDFKSSIICIKDAPNKIPDNYSPSSVTIDGEKVNAYKLNPSSKFYLLYGINVETGEENLYVYDSVEKTIQRYHDEEITGDYIEREELYQYVIIGLGGLLILTYLILVISLIINCIKKRKIKKKKMSQYDKEHDEYNSSHKDEEDA